jgi:hypothetical protein
MFELCTFLYFSRQITLKLTLKVNEFRGHIFVKGSPYGDAQTSRRSSKSNIVFGLLFQLDILELDLEDQGISWSSFPQVSPDVVKQNPKG